MRLREEPRPEDLEVVIFWARENGRAWPVNEDNVPLREDGTPFELDDDGLPKPTSLTGPPQTDVSIDSQEAEEFDPKLISTIPDFGRDIPERLTFKLKMLLGRDHNEITQAMIKTKTRSMGRGRRNRRTEVETEMDLALAVNLKLQKAIVEWEGISDKNGDPAEVTADNINLLPAWLQNDLVDRVDDMSLLTEEEEGE